MCHNIEYSSSIAFYNIDKCDKSKPPIIVFGLELGEDYEDPLTDGKDQVAGIVLNEGKRDTLIISEAFADSIDNPIFIIANHSNPYYISQEELETVNNDESDLLSSFLKSTASVLLPCYRIFYTCRIDYRYDKSAKSEYCINYSSFPEEGFQDADFATDGMNFQLYDVPKSAIGYNLSLTSETALTVKKEWVFQDYVSINQWDSNVLIWGMTYEKDWYASWKHLTINVKGRNFTIRGRMSFGDEYYQIINAYVPQSYPVSITTPSDHNGVYLGKGNLVIRGIVWDSCN